jgi:DDE domain
MTREGHVRFCESAGVRFPRATRPFLKVKGHLVYLYRAIDRDGNLVDVLLSEKRDKAAAEAFFRTARSVTGSVPERVTSDGHNAYPGAIKTVLVDCSVSFGTNCDALLFCPGVQVPARPGPVKGMRKATIVLRPTGIEVIDQLLP